MIPVTRTFLPPLEDYMRQVARAYDNGWLTNRGELVKELEQTLCNHLHIRDGKVIVMTNGTIPLQIAVKVLGRGGEIITTPFSYVATTSSIVWEGCTPVFVDIHPDYLTIDETKIEAAITNKTTCILATHVYGNPCHVEEIERIAKQYKLSVIYDAAHCFGVKYKGKSIFEYGDVSTCSFHATKVFHTGEGGAIFCQDEDLCKKLFYSHNFGHDGPLAFHDVGVNGKMSELQASMGLAVLPFVDNILESRRKSATRYFELLQRKKVATLTLRNGVDWNYSYFPVLFSDEDALLKAEKAMQLDGILPRRYFYPSLNRLPYVGQQSCPVAEDIAGRVLCLPLYHSLTEEEQIQVVSHLP